MSKCTGVSSDSFSSDKSGLGPLRGGFNPFSSNASVPSLHLFLHVKSGLGHAEGWDSHHRLLWLLALLKLVLTMGLSSSAGFVPPGMGLPQCQEQLWGTGGGTLRTCKTLRPFWLCWLHRGRSYFFSKKENNKCQLCYCLILPTLLILEYTWDELCWLWEGGWYTVTSVSKSSNWKAASHTWNWPLMTFIWVLSANIY